MNRNGKSLSTMHHHPSAVATPYAPLGHDSINEELSILTGNILREHNNIFDDKI